MYSFYFYVHVYVDVCIYKKIKGINILKKEENCTSPTLQQFNKFLLFPPLPMSQYIV